MSGPKCIRIVTIEEILEICHGHLARLDLVIARWEKVCGRNDAASEGEVKAMQERRAGIAALLTRQRYLDLQKRVPEEIVWIESDLERRVAEAARRVADARIRERRRAALAAQLLKQSTIPAGMRRDLEAIARGDTTNGPQAETIIGEALRGSLPVEGSRDRTNELSLIAEHLAAGQRGQTLDDWLATHPGDKEEDAVGSKVDIAIARLAAAGADKDVEAMTQRLRATIAEPVSTARKMRLDSLLLDAGRTLERHREHTRQLADLEQVLAEARVSLGSAHASLVTEAESALQHGDVAAAVPLRSRLHEAIEVQRRLNAAAARRRAVLAALAEVGYEAREGMETAAPGTSGLVLRRANNPEMGVEIAGGEASARLQLRPVRFAAPDAGAGTAKDQEVETIWCRDFDTLLKRLRKLDAELAVEYVTPVGAVPVLVMQAPPIDERRRSIQAASQAAQRKTV